MANARARAGREQTSEWREREHVLVREVNEEMHEHRYIVAELGKSHYIVFTPDRKYQMEDLNGAKLESVLTWKSYPGRCPKGSRATDSYLDRDADEGEFSEAELDRAYRKGQRMARGRVR